MIYFNMQMIKQLVFVSLDSVPHRSLQNVSFKTNEFVNKVKKVTVHACLQKKSFKLIQLHNYTYVVTEISSLMSSDFLGYSSSMIRGEIFHSVLIKIFSALQKLLVKSDKAQLSSRSHCMLLRTNLFLAQISFHNEGHKHIACII